MSFANSLLPPYFIRRFFQMQESEETAMVHSKVLFTAPFLCHKQEIQKNIVELQASLVQYI